MKKRDYLLVLCFLMAVIWFLPIGTNVAEWYIRLNREVTYVALGDSIAAGFGLDGYEKGTLIAPPKKSYQRRIADALETESVNWAVTGRKSSGLLKALKRGDMDEDLLTADYVTISIGSNDLLKPFEAMICEEFGVEPGKGSETMRDLAHILRSMSKGKLLKIIGALKEEMAANQELVGAVNIFEGQFAEILELTKEKAPDAKIFVTNLYNPYYGINFANFLPIGKMANYYIVRMNQAIARQAKDCTVVNIYKAFNHKGLTNIKVGLGNISIDPHPNAKGHAIIAELIAEQMRVVIPPSRTRILSLASDEPSEIFIRFKDIAKADGYEIYYAKEGNEYKLLKSTKKTSLTITSRKLRTGGEYLFLVTPYRLNGLFRVYGEESVSRSILLEERK